MKNNAKWARLVIAAFFILNLATCTKTKPKPDDFGITLVELLIDSTTQGRLNSSTATKKAVATEMKIDGELYKIKVNHAGKSTLDNFKKQYQIEFIDKTFNGRTKYRLNALGTDVTGIKATLGFEAYRRAGLASPEVQPAAVYLNGKYHGLYALIEFVDEEFLKRAGFETKTIYKATLGNATFGKELLSGVENGFVVRQKPKQLADIKKLIEIVNSKASTENNTLLQKHLHLDSYLKYVMASQYLANWDAYKNNFYMFRAQDEPRFQFVPWDLDHIYENNNPEISYINSVTIFPEWSLGERVFSYEDNKKRYFELFNEYLASQFTTEQCLDFAEKELDKVEKAYRADRVLLGSGRGFDEEKADILSAIAAWHSYLKADLKQLSKKK